MLEVFYDAVDPGAHEKFVKWLRGNSDGYYINCRTGQNIMLHATRCRHVNPDEEGSSHEHGDQFGRVQPRMPAGTSF